MILINSLTTNWQPVARMAPRFLRGHRVPGICGKGLHGVLFVLREVARLLVGDPQGHAGVRVAAAQAPGSGSAALCPVELAEVHIAEALVVKKIGIIGIQGKELLQVDAGLVQGGREA